MEPKNEGLEDDLPFQLGDFWVQNVDFQVCLTPVNKHSNGTFALFELDMHFRQVRFFLPC